MSSSGKDLRIAYLLDFYGDLLTEKQKDVIDLYYNEDLSLAEIAEILKITRQGVRDSIKHGESFLLEYESRLHLAERHPKMEKGFQDIQELCRGLRYYGQRHVYSKQIIEMAEKIEEIVQELEKSEALDKKDIAKEEFPDGF
jgi:hypothetical protein